MWSPDSTWDHYSYLSDLYYSLDPDSANPVPVLGIGRLPWSPSQSPTLPNFFAKIMTYESAPSEAWQARVHLIADSTQQFNFGQDFSEPLAILVPAGYTIERDYLDFPPGHEWHGDRNEVLANLQAGSFLANYFGYGSAEQWSETLQLSATAFDSLTNGERMPIFSSGGTIEMTETSLGAIPASLLFNPNGGAIAYFSRSYYAWANASIAYGRSIFRQALSDSVHTVGDIWRRAQYEYAHTFFWMPESWSPSQQTAMESMLLGDPGTRLPQRTAPVDEPAASLPNDMRLEANYPNPFNATTRLTYRLDRAGQVSLKVFDVLGREVAVLSSGMQTAGEHTISWDANGLASGVYFVVLQSGDVRQMQKMVLLK